MLCLKAAEKLEMLLIRIQNMDVFGILEQLLLGLVVIFKRAMAFQVFLVKVCKNSAVEFNAQMSFLFYTFQKPYRSFPMKLRTDF